MGADPASASGNGFDEALKALEELEAGMVETREDKPAAGADPIGAIAFSDAEDEEAAPGPALAPAPAPAALSAEDEVMAIMAMPLAELEEMIPAPVQIAVPPSPPTQAAAPTPPAPPAAACLEAQADAPSSAPVRQPIGLLVKAAVGLGLFSSLLSGIGLVVAERTIMSAQLVVADARERQHQLEQANKLIQDLELVRDRQIELLQAQRAQLASNPVTSDELQRKMDALQTGLLARDPLNNVVRAIHDGQGDVNARLNEFGMKMARVEAAIERR